MKERNKSEKGGSREEFQINFLPVRFCSFNSGCRRYAEELTFVKFFQNPDYCFKPSVFRHLSIIFHFEIFNW
jgi:hypothetical protein